MEIFLLLSPETFPIVIKTWGWSVQLHQSLIFIFVRKVILQNLGSLIHFFLIYFGGVLIVLVLVVTETEQKQLLVLRLGLGQEPNNSLCKISLPILHTIEVQLGMGGVWKLGLRRFKLKNV